MYAKNSRRCSGVASGDAIVLLRACSIAVSESMDDCSELGG